MTTATMARNGQMAQVSAWGSLYQMLMEALHGLDEAHERFALAQAQATDAALTADAAEQVYKDAAAALEVATRALHGVQYRVDALSNLVRGVQA